MTHDIPQSALSGIANASTPLDGVVTAGQPTAEQLQTLARAGIRTVVDLRAPGEPRGFDEDAVARAAGLDYRSLPVTPATLGAAQFDEMRRIMRDASARPLLVHCASANRVGAALLPWLVLDEQRSPEDALRVARGIGMRSEELGRSAFDYIGDHEGR